MTPENARAAAILAETYGFAKPDVQGLPGDAALNFLAVCPTAGRAVLKILPAGAALDSAELPCAAMAHLAAIQMTFDTPSVRTRGDGSTVGEVSWFGDARLAYVVTYCDGRMQATLPALDEDALVKLGNAAAEMVAALADFEHVALDHRSSWNLTEAAAQVTRCHHIAPPYDQRAARILARFTRDGLPVLSALPSQAIHNDLNDHNILFHVRNLTATPQAVIDLGDLARQPAICELAILCAYSLMRQPDPVAALVALVRGFHATRALTADEIDVLPLLVKTRLAVSLAHSSARRAAGEDDPYIAVSQAGARGVLDRLDTWPERIVQARLRHAIGLPGVAHRKRVLGYLASADPRPVMDASNGLILDLGVGSLVLGADPAHGALDELSRRIDQQMDRARVVTALGRYLEPRLLYAADGFGGGHPTSERRTIHLGVDVFCAAGAPVFAPFAGQVHAVADLDRPLDYGPVLILRHDLPDGECFFTLYGHLDPSPALDWQPGDTVNAGELIAHVGAPPGNGGWPPHLHLQLLLDDLGLGVEFPGVCAPADMHAYAELCPNPACLIKGVDPEGVDAQIEQSPLLARRAQRLGTSLRVSYRKPLHIRRGFGAFLYDHTARAYLDFYNNVAHVGHSHPHVVDAIQRQSALLNTNTRYLNGRILDYADRLCARLPDPLSVCFFVNSASEANELALRLARQATGRRDMLVLDAAYHGHSSALIDLSPYKHAGPGGAGAPDWVHVAPLPDVYRGEIREDTPDPGGRYAERIGAQLAALPDNRACAAFIAETLPSVGGQIVPPAGFLERAYAAVRAHGALCIADEVQTGFGRLGDVFFGFEAEGVVPDVVVLGKPIANGYPMGAVVTTRAIADAFDNGMEFFATFGGNPVAGAAASAVLDVLERDNLPDRAHTLGQRLSAGLKEMATRYAMIGDVRGRGFFQGIELVTCRESRKPNAVAASAVVERLRDRGLLVGTDGPDHNVIKLRPTMVTTDDDVDTALALFDAAFDNVSRLT
ncbi:MAG: aminotransferase class III-fold pyridoxal phosphate-dependent enzyme [Pseudomonadota bacterium]